MIEPRPAPATQPEHAALDLDLEDLPVDVFDLVGSGLAVHSLTSGHGMGELGASSTCCSQTDLCSCQRPV